MSNTNLRESVTVAIREARERRVEFLNAADGLSFEEQLLAFDRIRMPVTKLAGRVGLYSSVHPDPDVRSDAEQIEQQISEFETELSLDRPLFDCLSAIDVPQSESSEHVRFLEHTLRDFRRSGVDQDEPTRARVAELRKELVEVGQEFDRNILLDTRSIRMEEGRSGLAGLPQDYIDAHEEDETGAVTITTDPPDFMPFMTYAESDDLRKRLSAEFLNRAWPQNEEVLAKLLVLRHELARLLGFEHFADYVTEDKMVKSAAAARAFVEGIREKAWPVMLGEKKELLEELRRAQPEATEVRDWQRGYLTERVKTRKFGFDSQSVRPFFAYANVERGVLEVAAELYGVEFRQVEDAEVWHPAVKCFEMFDGGELRARFYFDMHPREDKYKHAAMFHLTEGIEGEVLPEACLVCNFPEPKAGDPGLMQHGQVTTFFHEFGHLLHHLFGGRQRYLRFSGIATEWDFVEVPSQLFEEWAFDPLVLQRFAHHHESGEPISTELVESMRRAGEYGKGLQVSVQMYYALLSLGLYDRDPKGLDPMAFAEELKGEVAPIVHTEGTHFAAAFGHLHGYSAIYYTYMWSLVISKDLFSRFEAAPMDSGPALEYRRAILEAGGTRDAEDLVESFLGRPSGSQAWEVWLAS